MWKGIKFIIIFINKLITKDRENYICRSAKVTKRKNRALGTMRFIEDEYIKLILMMT